MEGLNEQAYAGGDLSLVGGGVADAQAWSGGLGDVLGAAGTYKQALRAGPVADLEPQCQHFAEARPVRQSRLRLRELGVSDNEAMDLPELDLPDLNRLALLVVDVQQGFDDGGYWGPRNNPDCEDNIAVLLQTWRQHGRPVVFVRHDSTEAQSPLRPGQPGNAFKSVVTGEPDLLITKTVNSCFHGTPSLDTWLRTRDLDGFVLAGITTNHCGETTARVGGNLGHQVLFALDATHTFDRPGPDGQVLTADELARATATNLHGEFATVVSTRRLVSQHSSAE